MNARRVAILAMFTLLLAGQQARAQCANWQAGPLDDGSLSNGTNGSGVHCSTLWDPDGAGPLGPELVVGGYFTVMAGAGAFNIAVLNTVTGHWQALDGGFDDGVWAVTVYNGDLIAAGTFTRSFSGTPVNHIARWDGSTWQPLGAGIDSGYVETLTVYNGELIAGGRFTVAGGQHANSIARWNGSSWQTLGSGVQWVEGQVAGVYAMAFYNGELLVGGAIAEAGGQPVGDMAAWNGSSWRAMDNGLGGQPFGLQLYNGAPVVVGTNGVGGYIARWNGTAWQPWNSLPGSGNSAYFIKSLVQFGGDLIAGGYFVDAGGPTLNNIARWDGVAWQPLFSGVGGPSPAGGVSCLILYNGEVIVGGTFNTAGNQPANNIARWNGFQWGPFGGGTVNGVYAMTNFMGQLVVGGDFHQTTVDGSLAHSIARWDGVWMTPYDAGMDAPVMALKSFKYPGIHGEYELIAGGYFTTAGGVAANCIARWDETLALLPPPQWQPMGAGFDGGVYAIERHTTRSGTATYAAGAFTYSSPTLVNHVARWNESTAAWEALGSGTNNWVYALKSFGGYLYAGGAFTTAGGVSTGGLARWDGSSWSQVGGYFNGTVYSLELHNNQLVIGGVFPGINGSPNLAQYDGSSYSTFGTGGTDAEVRSLYSTGTKLYVGGAFNIVGGVPAGKIACWDGAWHAVTGGADNTVMALNSFHNEIHAGGTFFDVGLSYMLSPCWAKYTEDGRPWIAYEPSSQSPALGGTVTFSVTPARPYDGLGYQWYRDGAPLSNGPTGYGGTISGAQEQVLTVTGVSYAEQGSYTMVLSNACGTDTSWVAPLTINATGVATPPPTGANVFEALGPNPTFGNSRLAF